jgi:hypothetical protein
MGSIQFLEKCWLTQYFYIGAPVIMWHIFIIEMKCAFIQVEAKFQKSFEL